MQETFLTSLEDKISEKISDLNFTVSEMNFGQIRIPATIQASSDSEQVPLGRSISFSIERSGAGLVLVQTNQTGRFETNLTPEVTYRLTALMDNLDASLFDPPPSQTFTTGTVSADLLSALKAVGAVPSSGGVPYTVFNFTLQPSGGTVTNYSHTLSAGTKVLYLDKNTTYTINIPTQVVGRAGYPDMGGEFNYSISAPVNGSFSSGTVTTLSKSFAFNLGF